jgi:glucose-6-phosphate 1-dehydrogenase
MESAVVRTADPSIVVIFGATGDLAKRKLLPALYNLATRHALPDRFRVVGVGRKPMSDDAYREKARQDLRDYGPASVDGDLANWFVGRLHYAFETLDTPASYLSLSGRLSAIAPTGEGPAGRLFYLATPPDAMADIVHQLGSVGLLTEDDGGWRRVIVEKPFGRDLASAAALNEALRRDLAERQIYRIDHYLGKETVQNLMAFRFGNGIFEPIWNRRYVDHVQITVAETVGVEDRGRYYESAGALRDMVQNHMLQLLALTAMEPPISFRADDVRNERVKLLDAVHRLTPQEVEASVVRAQYGPGGTGATAVPGYRSEPHVSASSTTETYIALRISVDNWRWADVPFYLRTGKRLAARASEIVLQFRKPPLQLFKHTPVDCLEPNRLAIRVQPDEGISLTFQAKVPGPEMRLGLVDMAFAYKDYFDAVPATGYETLLYDSMTGDQTLFHRADSIEAGWAAVAPVIEAVDAAPAGLMHAYPAFSQGPVAADRLLAREGRGWRRLAP